MNKTIDYKSYNIKYFDKGSGFPIVYLHEWNGSSLLFRKYISPKLKGSRVITFDLPGFGYAKDVSFKNITDILEYIYFFIEKTRIEYFDIIGNCLGSSLALDIALKKYNAQIRRVIILEPIMYQPLRLKIAQFPILKHIVYTLLNRTSLTKLFTKNSILKALYKTSKRESSLTFLSIMSSYGEKNHFDRLKKLNKPVDIIHGEFTYSFIQESISGLLKSLPSVKVHEMCNGGHFLIPKFTEEINMVIKKS